MPGVCRSAPRRLRLVAPDHYSPVRLLACPNRSRLLAATFRSLATTACFQATITRSKFPACCFFATPDLPGNRSADCSPSPGGSHPPRSGSWLPARLPVPDRTLPAVPRISTPLRGFPSLPDQSVQPDSLPKDSPSGYARLLFAPRNRSIGIVPVADHRSELATLPEARCSSKPLGTTFIMNQAVGTVKLFLG